MDSSLVSSRRGSIVAPVAALIALLALAGCGGKEPPAAAAPTAPAGPPPTPTLDQLRAATVSGVFEQPVTLAGGRYEGPPFEAGGASRPALMLWEPGVHFGNVDGAEGSEAVALLSATTGGSGEMVYLAAFGVRDGALANLGTVLVGDRTRVQSVWLEQGKVIMDAVEIGSNDAACCPTQVARKTFGLEGGALKQLSSEIRGVLALSMLAANEWTLVEMDGQPLPAGVDAPLIHFERESVRGFAGCNRFNATVKESKPGEIAIGPAAGTKMACPPEKMELEARFLEQLAKVTGYGYVAEQLALTWQDGERSGTLLFRK
jgi:heat shock protein HslJ/predicted small lipoprotein YifL